MTITVFAPIGPDGTMASIAIDAAPSSDRAPVSDALRQMYGPGRVRFRPPYDDVTFTDGETPDLARARRLLQAIEAAAVPVIRR